MENLHGKGSIPVEKRTDGEYELAFENVSFHYPGNEEPVLKNVSCKLNIRGKLAAFTIHNHLECLLIRK